MSSNKSKESWSLEESDSYPGSSSTSDSSSTNSVNVPYENPFSVDPWSSEEESANKDKLQLTETDQAKLASRGYEVSSTSLGTGSFGVVYKATYYEHACAVKSISIAKDKPVIQLLFGELSAMRRTKHPCVVQVMDMFVTAQHNQLLVFMELIEGGNLRDYLKDLKAQLPELQVSRYYRQFGDAFLHMHSLGIAHRDIKSPNILLDRSKQYCKVTDFGLSTIAYDESSGQEKLHKTRCGSFVYMAPEVIQSYYLKLARRSGYDAFKVDVWSTGVLLYEMIYCGKFPFDTEWIFKKGKKVRDHRQMYTQRMNRMYKMFNNKRYKCSPDAMKLIAAHLEPSPQDRPTFQQILQCEPWLQMNE